MYVRTYVHYVRIIRTYMTTMYTRAVRNRELQQIYSVLRGEIANEVQFVYRGGLSNAHCNSLFVNAYYLLCRHPLTM